MRRDGWENQNPPGTPTHCALWLHTSGWEVQHCGHQTANNPYHGNSPCGVSPVLAENGSGFTTLLAAMVAVESVVNGFAGVDAPAGGRARIVPFLVLRESDVLKAWREAKTASEVA